MQYLFARNPLLVVTFLIVVAAGCGGPKPTEDTAREASEVQFRKHALTRDFISEGAAFADVNRDGLSDVLAGSSWFEAPDWTRHEIFPGKTFDGAKEYSNSFLNYSMDVDQDGWMDLVLVDFPGTPAWWYANPGERGGHWTRHRLHATAVIGNESPAFVDIDGDGRKDLLFGNSAEKQMTWLRAPHTPGDTTFTLFTVSAKDAPGTDRFSHGLGFGDINGDGRGDVVVTAGWWEGPEDPTQPDWRFHPAPLGEACSQMHVVDVNGDGLNDILTASAHHYGIWWYEQQQDESGVRWTKHEVSRDFSQSHASAMVDIDGDGHSDFVVGKRYYAHNDTDNDPGRDEPAVLYWFRHTPDAAPYLHPHLIDDDSGSGLNIAIDDYNGDGLPDVAVANKKGVYVFEQTSN